MGIIKRKAGRPRKEKPVVEVKKTQAEIKLEKAEATIESLQEIIQGLEELVDVSYRRQVSLRDEIDRCLNMTMSHCDQVERNTGHINQDDIQYCVLLAKRILANKFDPKSED